MKDSDILLSRVFRLYSVYFTMVMRRTSLVLLLLLFTQLAGAQTQRVRLTVYKENCVPDVESYNWVQVKLYHLPDNSLAANLGFDEVTGERIQSALLPSGSYRAVYRNRMWMPRERKIVLGHSDTAIGFCIDSLPGHSPNTLARFRNGDSLILNYASLGCFHTLASRIVIRRSEGIFRARLYEADDLPRDKTSFRLVKDVVMDEPSKTAFRHFEQELSLVDTFNDCTTRERYLLHSPYGTVDVDDATCNWGGFSRLLFSLFKLPEE